MLTPLQFGPRPDPSGSKPFDTLIVFLKEIFEKVNFDKSADDNKRMKNYPDTLQSNLLIIILHLQSSNRDGYECLTRNLGVACCGFEPYRWHCVVSLSKKHYSLLSTGSTQNKNTK